MRPRAAERVDEKALTAYLEGLQHDGLTARDLDGAVDDAFDRIGSLSSLSAPLALEYLERLKGPVPALTLECGAEAVTRGYAAHLAVESEPVRFAAAGPPEPGGFPPLRRGSPPQDLLTRVVKASRRRFERIRAVPEPVWGGFVMCTARRLHRAGSDEVISVAAIDGLVRFGWALRHADAQYGLEPQERPAA